MFYAAQDLRTPAGKDASSPNAPTAPVKKAGIGWEHWTSQIDDHLKPPTAAKRCTFRESRKSPALRAFVAGRWALATTSLYPSTKIEHPQRAQNPAPGGVLSLNSDGLDGQDYRVITALDSCRPTRGPTPPKSQFRGPLPSSAPKPAHRGDTGRDGGFPPPVRLAFEHAECSWRNVGADHARSKCRHYIKSTLIFPCSSSPYFSKKDLSTIRASFKAAISNSSLVVYA